MHLFSRIISEKLILKVKSWLSWMFCVCVPVIGVRTEERCEHHHFILTADDLSDCEDLVLRLRVADIQHCGSARFILSHRAFGPMSHLNRKVWRELTFYILRWHLGTHREFKKKLMSHTFTICMSNSDKPLCLMLLFQGLQIDQFLTLRSR